jgi:hypothetical protein
MPRSTNPSGHLARPNDPSEAYQRSGLLVTDQKASNPRESITPSDSVMHQTVRIRALGGGDEYHRDARYSRRENPGADDVGKPVVAQVHPAQPDQPPQDATRSHEQTPTGVPSFGVDEQHCCQDCTRLCRWSCDRRGMSNRRQVRPAFRPWEAVRERMSPSATLLVQFLVRIAASPNQIHCRRVWSEAFGCLAEADRAAPLAAQDLDLLADTAHQPDLG